MKNNHNNNQLTPITILLKIPVPWVFIITYLVGLVPQFIFPAYILSQHAIIVVKITGMVLFVIGAFFASWSLLIFRKARTTTTREKVQKGLSLRVHTDSAVIQCM